LRGHFKYRSDDSPDDDFNPVNKHNDKHINDEHINNINNINNDHSPSPDLRLSVRDAQRQLRV